MQIKINAHNHDEILHLCLFLRNSESIFIIPPIPISEFQTVSASRHGFAIWLFIQNGTVLLIWISFSTYQFYVPPTLNIFLSKCNVMKTNISRTLFSWWAQLIIFVLASGKTKKHIFQIPPFTAFLGSYFKIFLDNSQIDNRIFLFQYRPVSADFTKLSGSLSGMFTNDNDKPASNNVMLITCKCLLSCLYFGPRPQASKCMLEFPSHNLKHQSTNLYSWVVCPTSCFLCCLLLSKPMQTASTCVRIKQSHKVRVSLTEIKISILISANTTVLNISWLIPFGITRVVKV